ncbi:MAG: class I SAM-dependent methyltransferase [Syntrophobacteraceae bacterium]
MAEEKFDFDKKAASWDNNPARVKLANDIAGAIIDEKIFAPDMDVLEFGCGTGLLTLKISPLVRSITGVDGSRGMLGVLEAKIKERGVANIKTQRVDPSAGGVIEGCYGAVISSMTLHHVKDIGSLFDQFHRVTAPGGYVCLADLDSEEGRFHGENPTVFHNGFERKMVEELLVDAGFREVRDKTAAVVQRPVAGGPAQTFSIFLITCRKSG